MARVDLSHLSAVAAVLSVILSPTSAIAYADAPEVVEIPATGSVDLSRRSLGPTLQLTVRPSNASRVTLGLLNVSGNPGLERIVMVDRSLLVMQVAALDLTGTSVVPDPAMAATQRHQLIHFAQPKDVLLSVIRLFVNHTARPQLPLDFPAFADLLYRLRVQSFILDNWTVAGFHANFSQENNACQSKMFDSVAVRAAGIGSLVNGAVSATRGVDLRRNRIRLLENVTFNSSTVHLEHNLISRLVNVTFLPGGLCRSRLTGQPELWLSDNALTLQALDALAGVNNSGSGNHLRGLDLSRNPLIGWDAQTSSASGGRVRIAEWLRLDSVIVSDDGLEASAIASALAGLLNRFEAPQPIRLDLSGNRLTSLAAVSRILTGWRHGSSRPLRNLRLANNAFVGPNLNLSELGLTATSSLQLGDLADSRVRSLSLTTEVFPSGGDFNALVRIALPDGSRVDVVPRPSSCCSVASSAFSVDVFCFLQPAATSGFDADWLLVYRRRVCGDGGVGGGSGGGGSSLALPSVFLIVLCLAAALLTAAAVVTGGVLCALRLRRRRRLLRLRQSGRQAGRRTSGRAELGGVLGQPLKLGEKATLPGAVEGD